MRLDDLGRFYQRLYPLLSVALDWNEAAALLLARLLYLESSPGQPFNVTFPSLVVDLGLRRKTLLNARNRLVELRLLVSRRNGQGMTVQLDHQELDRWWASVAEQASSDLHSYARSLSSKTRETVIDIAPVDALANAPSGRAASARSRVQNANLLRGRTHPDEVRELPEGAFANAEEGRSERTLWAPSKCHAEPNEENLRQNSGTDSKQSVPLAQVLLPSISEIGTLVPVHLDQPANAHVPETQTQPAPTPPRAPKRPRARAVGVGPRPARDEGAGSVTSTAQADAETLAPSTAPTTSDTVPFVATSPTIDDRALTRVTPESGVSLAPATVSDGLQRHGVTGVKRRGAAKESVEQPALVRPADVSDATMRAWAEGAFDAQPLTGPGTGPAFDAFMRALAAIRARFHDLETSGVDGADCVLVRKKLKAGYKPSELARAVGGSRRHQWLHDKAPTLKQIWTHLDACIAATTSPTSGGKEQAVAAYLDVRAEYERVCFWDARENPALDSPSIKTAAELRALTETMRAAIQAKQPPTLKLVQPRGDR
jgi:hypothetical protein